MFFLKLSLIVASVVHTSAFVNGPDTGSIAKQLKTIEQTMSNLQSTVHGCQTSANASQLDLTSLKTKFYALEKELFITKTEQKTYETKSDDRLKKLENRQIAYEQKSDNRQKRIEDRQLASERKSRETASVGSRNTASIQNLESIVKRLDVPVVYSSSVSVHEQSAHAGCPYGYKMLRCDIDGLENSDGPYIFPTGTCYSRHSTQNEGTPIRARATCGRQSDVGDLKYVKGASSGSPSVSCPYGYAVISCVMYIEQGERQSPLPQGVIRGRSCVSDTCTNTQCVPSAICQKI